MSSEHEDIYFQCLEDWSDEIREAADHKQRWYGRMKDTGLRVKLAQDDEGVVGGMIQYAPVEQARVEGRDLYFVYCIWVHGYPEGRGNFQRKGMGTALLEAAEADVRSLGAKGMAAWGVSLPFFMRASWFKKHGYRVADRDGIALLLWKSFSVDAEAPVWVKQKKTPDAVAGQVTVHAFIDGWCPAQNMVFERAKRAARDVGGSVVFKEYHTSDPDVFAEWGIGDALYVDTKRVRTGPPPTYEKIRKVIEKRLRRLPR